MNAKEKTLVIFYLTSAHGRMSAIASLPIIRPLPHVIRRVETARHIADSRYVNAWRAVLLCRLGHLMIKELLVFRRSLQGGSRRLPALNDLGHGIEITGAHLALVLDGGKALFGSSEFGFLQFDNGRHLLARLNM